MGMAECVWLDFKRAPYALDTAKGKFELCKDVAAFANAQGGLLVCGVEAVKQSDRALEVVTACLPFPQSKADVDRYIDTLNEYLRPRVVTSHRWYRDPVRSTAELDKHYLVIEVDPVPEMRRYVIVRRVLNDKQALVEGLVVPLRHGDRTVYLPSEDAYQLINEGLRGRDVPDVAVGQSRSGIDDDADQSLDVLERLQDWHETPVLFWQSIPSGPAQVLPGLHSNDGVKGGLWNQRVLRESGFNFEDSLGALRVFEGGRLLSRGRCALWVRPDGVMTAGAIATPDMLGWGMDERGRPGRINVAVLTEMTLEYFRLADELVLPRLSGAWRHRVVARRFQGEQPRVLGPGGTSPMVFLSDGSPASSDSWDRSWPAVGDPERDAFEALRMIYTLFGVDVTTNPDVENDRVLTQSIQSGTG
jgi:hypothetical protein